MSDKSQRTEKPTPKRRREAVREGRIPRSADVTAWLTVLVFTLLIPMTVDRVRTEFAGLVDLVVQVIANPDAAKVFEVMQRALTGVLGTLAPVLLGAVVVALAGNAAQGGLRVSSKRFKPKMEHLNLLKGIKRMLGAQAAWGLAKTLVKFAVFGFLAYSTVRGVSAQITGSGSWSLSSSVKAATGAALSLMRTVSAVGLVIAAADYLVERRRVEKSLMMSREEIKREARQSEGDPYQKGALRGRQRELSRNRMMSNVATADVVVVNPTHVAVALRYEAGSGAPLVVAKGADAVATRIREEAAKHRLPLVEDVPLARTLYRACEVGQEIPVDLYDAVARVLAFVMALRRRGSVAGLHRGATLTAAGIRRTNPPQVARPAADESRARTAPSSTDG